jgi:hypothetical protein
MELIELIIRFIAWLAEPSDKKKAQAQQVDPAAMAEWEQRRAQWEAQQRQAAAAALLASVHPQSVRPPVVAPPPVPRAAPAQASPRAAESAAKVRSPKPVSAKAAAINRWANPRTLRSQFILTEVLKPPLAMREPH